MVCGEASAAEAALEEIARLQPDLAVVDVSLPGIDGLELIRRLLACQPSLQVLVLSMHDEVVYAERVLRAGARGYLMKDQAGVSVVDAARRVLDGEIYLSPAMTTRILEGALHTDRPGPPSPTDHLTDRELEVFRKIGEGQSTREIANDLGLSIKTIETYRERIKEKLHLRRATELVRFAIQWVETDDVR